MALITLRQLLDHAAENGYGMPAFNITNLETLQAVMAAAREHSGLRKRDGTTLYYLSASGKLMAAEISLDRDAQVVGRRELFDFPFRFAGNAVRVCMVYR